MAQLNWTYVGNYGKSYQVGLFHGDRTGHLLVYCNSKIILIDFSVNKTSKYSFFIEDDLCEISIEKEANEYRYGFDINREIDTPRNRERKQTEKKHWRQTLAFFGVFAVFIVAAVIGLLKFNSSQNLKKASQILDIYRQETIAKVFLNKSDAAKEHNLSYSFVANGKRFEGNLEIASPYLSFGMPIEPGDEFVVAYASIDPEIHQLDLNYPTESQIAVYKNRVLQKHTRLHNELSTQQVQCIISEALRMRGLKGLAYFYLQDITSEENEEFNATTYEYFTRSIEFRNAIEEQCLLRIN